MPTDPSPWTSFLGHLHPLLVHFPIALTLAAALFEVLDMGKRNERGFGRRQASPVALRCLVLAAMGAIAAATTGWIDAAVDPPGASMQETLTWHRWTGVAIATVTTLALALAALDRMHARSGYLGLYRFALLVAAVLVSANGYLGGTITHGKGHLTAMFGSASSASPTDDSASRDDHSPAKPPPTSPAPAPGQAPGHAPATSGAAPPIAGARVEYAAHVAPIFAARCVECHGPAKQKAKLRLDELAYVLEKRGVVEPGQPFASALYHRVALPADHEDRMPAKGDPLTAAQIATIRTWIEQMAPGSN